MTEELEKPRKKQVNGAKYVGGGKFVFGVPARDHTKDEWEAYTKEERKHFCSLGLFEVIYD